MILYVPTELLALLHCVLEDSPQAIHLISDDHIKQLIQLLAKKGCDEKVGYKQLIMFMA